MNISMNLNNYEILKSIKSYNSYSKTIKLDNKFVRVEIVYDFERTNYRTIKSHDLYGILRHLSVSLVRISSTSSTIGDIVTVDIQYVNETQHEYYFMTIDDYIIFGNKYCLYDQKIAWNKLGF